MRRSLTLLLTALVLLSAFTTGCRLRDRAGTVGNPETPAVPTSASTGSITLPPTDTPAAPLPPTTPDQPTATVAPQQPTATPVPPTATTDPAITALEDSLLSGFDRLATQNAEADDLSDTDSVVGP